MSYWSGKTVLVTGASAGIGKELSLQLAKSGANVILTARRMDRLTEIAEQINLNGGKALAISLDVTSLEESIEAIKKAAQRFSSLDAVIANAGFGVAGNFERLSNEDYQRQFDTNIFGVMNIIRASLPHLKASKGMIGIIGSVNSYISLPGNSAYAMSKFAIKALSQSLQMELTKQGVSVTLLCPGFVDSEIRKVNNQGEYNPKAKEIAPAKLIMPTDVAAKQILIAIAKRKKEKIITGHGKVIVLLQRFFPGLTHQLIAKLGK